MSSTPLAIEANIAIPPPEHGRRRYYFHELARGESFMLGTDEAHYAATARALRQAAWSYATKTGKVFVTRAVKERGVRVGIRCWRAA